MNKQSSGTSGLRAPPGILAAGICDSPSRMLSRVTTCPSHLLSLCVSAQDSNDRTGESDFLVSPALLLEAVPFDRQLFQPPRGVGKGHQKQKMHSALVLPSPVPVSSVLQIQTGAGSVFRMFRVCSGNSGCLIMTVSSRHISCLSWKMEKLSQKLKIKRSTAVDAHVTFQVTLALTYRCQNSG